MHRTGATVGAMTDSTPSAPAHQPVPYGTPEAPRVAVRGEAHLEADPELARIWITVVSRGPDRRAALDDLGRRNATVLDLVRGYPEALASVETGAFSVRPELGKNSRSERVRAYHGLVRLTAEFTDFTPLGELATRLADFDFTRVHGPSWCLRPDSPVHREARKQAVREAVLRAREYAEALGTRLAALVEIADTGAEPPALAGYEGASMGSLRRQSGAPDPGPLDFEPERQHVYARVNARFTMVPPVL